MSPFSSPEVLEYRHYRSLVEIRQQAGPRWLFGFASLSADDPRVCILPKQGTVLVGCFQTLYGIDAETGGLEFQIIVPEGGEVSQLEAVGEDRALVVSETTVRCVSYRGAVIWVLNYADRVKLVDVTDREVTCVSLEPGSSGVPWRATYNLNTGLPIEVDPGFRTTG